MKHYIPTDAAQAASEISALFTQVADTIKAESKNTIRHLAPETPCFRAGNLVYNEMPASGMDPRSVVRLGRIGDDGKLSFFASAYTKGYNDTPVIKLDTEGKVALAIQAAALELNIR